MNYKNPIPSVDDECVSKIYSMSFTFDEKVTLEEAVEGINELLSEHGGKIPPAWVRMGEPKSIRFAKKQS